MHSPEYICTSTCSGCIANYSSSLHFNFMLGQFRKYEYVFNHLAPGLVCHELLYHVWSLLGVFAQAGRSWLDDVTGLRRSTETLRIINQGPQRKCEKYLIQPISSDLWQYGFILRVLLNNKYKTNLPKYHLPYCVM